MTCCLLSCHLWGDLKILPSLSCPPQTRGTSGEEQVALLDSASVSPYGRCLEDLFPPPGDVSQRPSWGGSTLTPTVLVSLLLSPQLLAEQGSCCCLCPAPGRGSSAILPSRVSALELWLEPGRGGCPGERGERDLGAHGMKSQEVRTDATAGSRLLLEEERAVR